MLYPAKIISSHVSKPAISYASLHNLSVINIFVNKKEGDKYLPLNFTNINNRKL